MQDPHTNPHHERRWLILFVIAIAQLMVVLDATVVNIALPSAQEALEFSNDQRQWVITAYALAFGSLLLLGGRIGDLFGRKRAFVIGLGGFAGASALGGFAQSFEVLVAARALQGVFGALLAPAALSILTTTFTDPKERGKAFGIFGAVAVGGAAIGLIIGGVLTQYLDWRWCLYVNLAFAVPAMLAAMPLLRNEIPELRSRIDIPGALTATAGLFAIVYGLANSETNGWADPVTIGMLVASVVLLAAFVVIQTRSANPLLPLRVVLDRDRGGSFLAMVLAGAGMFGVFLFLTYYLQQNLEFSPIQAGFAFLPMTFSIVIAATSASTKLLPKFGPRPLIARRDDARRDRSRDADEHRRRHRVRHPRPARHPRHRRRHGHGLRLRDGDRHVRRRARRRGRRVGDGQHDAAGRRLDRHRPAEHDGCVGGDEPARRGGGPAGRGARGAGRGARLHDRVLVGGRHLRRRRRDLRGAADAAQRRGRGQVAPRRAGVRARLNARTRPRAHRPRGAAAPRGRSASPGGPRHGRDRRPLATRVWRVGAGARAGV